MTQHDWDLIGYGVWAVIIWMTIRQYAQAGKAIEGNGIRLLLGDWMLLAPLPWIIWTCAKRGTLVEICWSLAIGFVLSLPFILVSSFKVLPDKTIQIYRSPWFVLLLFGFPLIRYWARNQVFHSNPIFFSGTHYPDIELMLALYILVLVIHTFVWRVVLFSKYKRFVEQKNPQFMELKSKELQLQA